MYKLSVTDSFSAAHRLCGYEGACSNLHGHNWKVRVGIRAEELDSIGMALDFGRIKDFLQKIMAELDHAYLNEHQAFTQINPTSENLARFIHGRMEEALKGLPAKVCEVEVCESERSSVVYTNA